MTDLAGKTALVTGATGGIGYETALALARLGADVIVHGRTADSAVRAVGRLAQSLPSAKFQTVAAEFSDLAAVRTLATALPPLDILVNNAGCWTAARSETRDGFETQFGVNHLAPWLLTQLLLPNLSDGARIVMVSSRAHWGAALDLDDLQAAHGRYSGVRAYANAKLCNLLMMQALVRQLAGSGITVNALHPGAVATDIARSGGAVGVLLQLARPLLLSAAQGARTSVYLASAADLTGKTGGYYENSAPARSLAAAQDAVLADKLSAASARLCGID